MKISCIALNSNLIESDEQSRIIQFINMKLYEIGEKISLISYFDNNYDKIKAQIFEDNQIVFFIGTSEVIYNHNIKDNLARVFGDKLEVNQTSYLSLNKYCEKNNIPFSVMEESEVLLPSKCIPLTSNDYYNNGFMYKNNNTYIIFLPDNIEFVKFNYFAYILPLLNDLINIKQEYQIVKCFGLLEKDLRSLISEFFAFDGVTINIKSDYLDNTIYIRYNTDVEVNKVQELTSNIVGKLNKFIYALEDVSIYQMAVDLLEIQKKTISIAETITYGNVTKELANCNSKNIKNSGVYLDYDRMINELKCERKIINEYGKYSVNTVYELSNLLLEKCSTDIVLYILGDKDKSEYCYIAIGDFDGIHVYKNKINNSNIILNDTLSKTAVFYLIKKLKQNSLQFI